MSKTITIMGCAGDVVAFAMLALVYLFAAQPLAAEEKCKISVGFGVEPPYSYPDDNGRIIGIDVDIFRTVSKDVGCDLEFLERPWKRTLAEVKSGILDATFGASLKKERTKFAHYSLPYRGQPHVIFEHKKNASDHRNLNEYLTSGKKLGVVAGWHYTNDIRKFLDDPAFQKQIETAPDIDSLYRMHARNRFDGFLANPSLVAGTFGKDTLNEKFNMIRADVDILHILFSKKAIDAKLVERFNNRLGDRIRKGFFLDVCRKYEDQLVAWCEFLSTADKVASMDY